MAPADQPATEAQEQLRARLIAALNRYSGGIPASTLAAIEGYVLGHVPQGSFMTAVFENNLMEALAHADRGNELALKAICVLVWNECPAACWGSPENVAAWTQGRMLT